ncbi:hypothetical protein Lfu02_04050 [Longispora fulva]|uniref:Uncharacterized protein n=1 Tax=Longispora fulva TaxID=619741 RepID=A0A8J7GGL3_9ACTN|nr:hypothetical protein [Longispora fulva]MBG6135728.1 hypothetical protein [Longispora fulva]GIG56033.1 hypothetical protein Lfu02_04050 [Longispora fulva]
MNPIADDIRQTLSVQVAEAPQVSDVADRAIVVADRIRRRRAVTVVAGLVTVVSLLGGTWLLRGHSLDPRPEVPPGSVASVTVTTPPGLKVDQFKEGELLTADGRRLATPPQTDAIWRVDGGWLLKTRKGATAASLLFMDRAGTQKTLLDGVDRFALAPDRVRVAWNTSTRMSVGRFAHGAVVEEHSTVAPETGGQMIYTGRVVHFSVLRQGVDHQDLWVPELGGYQRSYTVDPLTTRVSSPTTDEQYFIGSVAGTRGERACPALLDGLNALRAVRTFCDTPAGVWRSGGIAVAGDNVSADGRHVLSYQDRGGDSGTVEIYPTDGSVIPTAVCSFHASELVWEDDNTVVGINGKENNTFYRCHLSGDVSTLAGPSGNVRFVR